MTVANGVQWLRRNLFSSINNTGLTLTAAAVVATILPSFLRWAVFAATLAGSSASACNGDGACWTFIRVRLPLLIYGHYPAGQIWRVHLAAAILVVICIPLLRPRARHRGWMLLLLLAYPAVAGVLLVGGTGPLVYVDPDNWGGLMLNIIITVLVTVLALPFGTALALGRQSPLRVIRAMSICYIEFWRGLPLLGVLFISAVMLPLFLPQGFSVGRLLRAVAAMGLFSAAYIAEVVRGGLIGVDIGQEEAAAALGLRAWHNTLLICLPQALRLSIPGLVNTVIDLFKDTTLISIIGLYELLGTVSQALRDPAWPGVSQEAFTFAAAVFFVFCFGISTYSRALERRLGLGTRRR